jgi:lipopolysaccharide transport system ATP-binding protein
MSVAIRAHELTKSYRLYSRPADRFLELFSHRKRHSVFPAIQEVSFEIEKGETIGLIGENGAGKSTLLKLLCRVTHPTSGWLESTGTIASILELGTGFHPEFTGRDNAALNAAILGLGPAEIRRRLPDILEFSELGRFLDQPVKTYSSGMFMRLAFSVAVNVDPDILVIDEALAVGDGHFQKKCIDRIREFQEARKTIFFCSHALYFVTTLCQRTMWLDGGTLRRFDRSVDVVHDYETFLLEKDRTEAASTVQVQEPRSSPVRISAMVIERSDGQPASIFETGEDFQIRLSIDTDSADIPFHLLVSVNRAADDMQCFVVATKSDGLAAVEGSCGYDVVIRLREVPLLRGDYALTIFAGDESAMHIYDRRDFRPAFSISGERFEVGIVAVRHEWEASPRPELLAARR